MNWHQIGSQLLSSAIAGVVSLAPLGLAAKFYIDRALKKLDARDAARLEMLKDELSRSRDSRQALITHSSYATQKTLELEFKAISDLFAGIARLRLALDMCRPFSESHPANETEDKKRERQVKPVKELATARNDFLTLLANAELFCTDTIHQSATECLLPVWNEILQVIYFAETNPFSPLGYQQAQKNKEQFNTLARNAKYLLRERMDKLKRLPN